MLKILIAEDEEPIANLVKVNLTKAGYACVWAQNGMEAADYMMNESFDLVLLDIMLPGIDGYELLDYAKKLNFPVIFLTALGSTEHKVKGLRMGADDYLTKPFAMKELLARVRAMLRRRTESVDTSLSFGDITLELSTSMLVSGEGRVRLTNKEFQMLEMLINADGGIISVERFMDKIWGYDSETEQNVVWVYVSYLRRKLTGLGSSVRIEAHRNLGYSLEAGK